MGAEGVKRKTGGLKTVVITRISRIRLLTKKKVGCGKRFWGREASPVVLRVWARKCLSPAPVRRMAEILGAGE